MKKILLLCLTFVLLVTASVPVCAYRLGDVIGTSLFTDIVAQINGYDISSFNYEGYTYVIAEDLQNYGFNVSYNDYSRTLSITRNYDVSKIYSTYKKPEVAREDIGMPAFNLLYTDIKTFIDGRFVTSYNLGGLTIIGFDDLERYGTYVWDNSKRKITLDMPGIEKRGVGLDELKDLWNSPNRIKYDVQDNYGNVYDRVREVYFRQKYLLDGKYNRFTATYFCPCDGGEWCILRIYADGKLIYEKEINDESKPVNIDLNISGCNVFEITESQSVMNFSSSYFYNALLK